MTGQYQPEAGMGSNRHHEGSSMHYLKAVSDDEWPAAHRKLPGREKELTRQQDAFTVERRKLPMVQVQSALAAPCLSSVVVSRPPRLWAAR